MKVFLTIAMAAALLIVPAMVTADCNIQGTGEVNVISNSFPSLEIIAAAMKECNQGGVKVGYKLTKENREETMQAFAAAKCPYDIAQGSNSTIGPLQTDGLLRPMNDLVDKYRDKYKIEDSMLIKIGKEVYAIAFQVNAQHLFYRKDLFEKHNIAVPTTYDEVLAAAEKLKADDSIQFPLGGTYKSGWNLAQEFLNIYLATGAPIFKPGTAMPAYNSEKGVQALELMKKLMSYMSPNALALDTTAVMQQFQQGQIAMANLWASRAVKMDDKTESKVVGKVDFAQAPSFVKGGPPATTLWWDGFFMAQNMDGDPDLSFQVMMQGLGEDVVKANNDITIWLRSAYKPGSYSAGAYASAMAGAPPYPMQPQIAIVHSGLGNNIGDFLAGKESAQESLADAAAAYISAAKEKGFIK